MGTTTSERRRQRRHYLKMMKKQIGKTIDGEVFSKHSYIELKRTFQEQGKQMRIEDLRESLESEKELLIERETALRDKLKSDGLSKKKIDKAIESWYDSQKIWSQHSDVHDKI
jgi:hypothetical protein